MTASPKLDPRLSALSGLVRNGAYVCDVGTDHAYLPVSLVLSGRAKRAVASDINEGPVANAEKSVIEYGVKDKIDVVLSDGLKKIDHSVYPVTDIIIAGMGGELIVSILGGSELPKKKNVRLILQPMTHPEILREYLCDNGFYIAEEKIVPDASGKIYQMLAAEYAPGENTEKYTEAEFCLGKRNIERGGEEFLLLCRHTADQCKKIILSKEKAGKDAPKERRLYDAVLEIIKKTEKNK